MRLLLPVLASLVPLAACGTSPRPAEPDLPAPVTCAPAPLTVHGARFPGVLCRPADRAPVAAVLLLPGSLYLDVDGNLAQFGIFPRTYRDLAEGLASRGVAVLRHAKIGPGTGTEIVDADLAERHRRFETRLDVTEAALAQLRAALPDVAPVVLAGHSEGGVVALLAADRGLPIDGVVLLSTPSTGLLDILREQVAPTLPADELAVYDRVVASIRAGEPPPTDAVGRPGGGVLATMSADDLAYIRGVDAVDPVPLAAAYPGPVLIVQGTRDASVAPHHADALARARGTHPTEVARLPDLQHFYKRAAPDLDPLTAIRLDTETAPEVAASIVAWLRATRR